MDDLVACFNIQFPDHFRSEPLDLSVGGTATDLELSPSMTFFLAPILSAN